MCSTPNPVENVFCFKCNARLVPMTAPPEEDKPANAPPIKGLSLPTKAEELPTVAPTSDTPDWLSPTPAPAEETPAPPRDDSNWLTHLRASAPAAEEETTAANADDISGWLQTAPTTPPAEQPPAPAPPPTPAPTSNWLDNLRATESAPAEEPVATPSEDEPSWVAQLRASAPKEIAAGEASADVPDWLQSPSAPPAPIAPSEPPAPPPAPVVESSTDEPDWLKPASEPSPEPVVTDEGVPDWLRSVEPAAAAPPPPPIAAPAPVASIETPEDQVSDEEWLRRIQAGEGIQVPTAPALPRPPAQPFAEEEIPDWLRFATPSAQPEPLAGMTPVQSIEPAQVPAWIAALKPATEEDLSGTIEGEPIEATGPLAGLRGILPMANAIAEPHTLSAKQAAVAAPRRSGAHLFEQILAAPVAPAVAPAKKSARTFSFARWLIYLALLFAVVTPLVLPPDLTGAALPISRTPAREFFETLDQLATPNATMILAFEYEPGVAGEMDLQARALARYLAGKRVKLAALSTYETGPQLAQRVFDSLEAKGTYEYGAQMINLYVPGNEAALVNLATTKFAPEQRDWRDKKPIRPFLETARLTQLSDAALVIVLAGNEDALKLWMEQAQPRGIKIAAGVSAGVEPRARAYRDAGQLVAQMAGLSGAAQFEILSGKPDAAVRSASAQNAAIGLLVVVIVIGNLVLLFTRARTRSEKK